MYHLLNKCPKGANCPYQHGERLGQKEQMVLRSKSRGTLCPKGAGCMNMECVLGHCCPRGMGCERENCFFGSLHYEWEEMRVAMKVWEGDEVEIIRHGADMDEDEE